jgi:phage major head subunit gpT-like protein
MSLASGLTVNRDAGEIKDLSVITIGPAIGHGFVVDQTMLKQVADQINERKGVKSRLGHPSMLGEDPIQNIVGRFINARIEGDKVRADFKFSRAADKSPRGDLKNYLLDLAEDNPGDIGLSIVFEPDEFETDKITGRPIGRSLDVLAVDWVDDPAANPDGLLSAAVADAAMLTVTTPAAATVATAQSTDSLTQENQMSEPISTTTTAGVANPTVDAQALAADAASKAVAAERSRVSTIRELAKSTGLGDEFAAEFITSGAGIEDVRKAALTKLAEKNKPVSVEVGGDNNLDTLGNAFAHGISLRAGQKIEKPEARAEEFRHLTLAEMGRKYLKALGVRGAENMSATQVARMCFNRRELGRKVSLAHSTSDFDYILGTTIGKSLRNGYSLAPATWSQWARRTTAPDFKQVTRTQLSTAPSLLAVKEGEEYSQGTIGDKAQTYTLAKYGRIFNITWEAMINDDLNAFTRVPTAMGQAARRLEDNTVYSIFTANSNNGQTMTETTQALFHSSHANIGTSGTLTVSSLGDAVAKMRAQTAQGGSDYINLTPAYLLVPPALEITAKQLVASAVDPAKSNATPNPFANGMVVVVEPRLASWDANGFIVVADNNLIDTAEVAFLADEPEPVIEEMDGFEVDGRKYKVRHVLAAAAIDYRGFVSNAGGS